MYLRSGRTLDALDYKEMPENTMATAMAMPMNAPDRKQVLIDSTLRNKRILGLRTYFRNMEKERRGTLISLFKTGNGDAVNQIVDILLDLTLTTVAEKPPKII